MISTQSLRRKNDVIRRKRQNDSPRGKRNVRLTSFNFDKFEFNIGWQIFTFILLTSCLMLALNFITNDSNVDTQAGNAREVRVITNFNQQPKNNDQVTVEPVK
jgi:hypothetical protein